MSFRWPIYFVSKNRTEMWVICIYTNEKRTFGSHFWWKNLLIENKSKIKTFNPDVLLLQSIDPSTAHIFNRPDFWEKIILIKKSKFHFSRMFTYVFTYVFDIAREIMVAIISTYECRRLPWWFQLVPQSNGFEIIWMIYFDGGWEPGEVVFSQ